MNIFKVLNFYNFFNRELKISKIKQNQLNYLIWDGGREYNIWIGLGLCVFTLLRTLTSTTIATSLVPL